MFFKNIMKWLIMITIMITFSSNSWYVYWLMMEMNLLMFIPIMNNKKKSNSNSMIIYFVTQAFSSSMFFLSALNLFFLGPVFFKIFMMIALMIKLAMIPFHFWMTSLSEMIDHSSLFFMLTFQKFIPLFILTNMKFQSIIIFAAISSIFASLFALNSKLFKKILIFSSISHQGWVISLIAMKSNFWITYMLTYSLLIFKILKISNEYKMSSVHNFFFSHLNPMNKVSLTMMMMSLGGMPPFLGFFIKLISIIILINSKNLVAIILILSSMINIFFYIQIITPNFIKNSLNMKNLIFLKFNKKNMLINLNLLITIFILNLTIL
uniref:NADH-ubiquinone oxidoreductase chain 2 n=1 Tax=Amblyomma ovale TaxID=208206 RepID=A0A7D5KEY3_9ACAR|nr:NADH dehydrogenase subunit 2 [Amblyomma ovale]